MSEDLQPVVDAIDAYLAELREEIARLEEARSTLATSMSSSPPASSATPAPVPPAPPAPPRRRAAARAVRPRATDAPAAGSTDGSDGANDDGAPTQRMSPTEREAQILAVIGRRPTIGTPALAREVGLSLTRVAQLTRSLEAAERITRSGGGWLAAARKV